MRKKIVPKSGAPRLDPREAGTGPSPKIAASVAHALKERLRAIALARVQDDEARARGELSTVVREALEEKAAKEERRLGI
jgi:hypothetical protein